VPFKDLTDKRTYARNWRRDHAPRCRETTRKRKQARREWFRHYKATAGLQCLHCGATNPILLGFHHRNPGLKVKPVITMVNMAYSEKAIIEEVQKCDVLCCNCHSKLHAGASVSRVLALYTEAVEVPLCASCGETDSRCLVFHHSDPCSKLAELSYLSGHNHSPLGTLAEEWSKCVVLCANCHRLVHSRDSETDHLGVVGVS
jgi:hypothetical protein